MSTYGGTDNPQESGLAPNSDSAGAGAAEPLTGQHKMTIGEYLVPKLDLCIPSTQQLMPGTIDDAIAALKAVGDDTPIGAEAWRTEWFECFANPNVFLCTCCCGICVDPRTHAAVTGESCEGLCCSAVLLCCLSSCGHAARRTAMRTKYNLVGSRQTDCLLSCFCGPCIVCQEAREVQFRNEQYVVPGPLEEPHHDVAGPHDELME
jgi:Cys-rich protein (TIGR01571 family)